jgi:hypothetical protein
MNIIQQKDFYTFLNAVIATCYERRRLLMRLI